MNMEPHWIQIISWLSTPLVALGAAICAGIIAYWQWKTAENKLRLDLFDRRFAIYDVAHNLIGSAITTGITNDTLFNFDAGTSRAKWVLNDEIDSYFRNELGDRASKLKVLKDVADSLTEKSEQIENIQMQNQLISWFNNQYRVLDQKFAQFKLKR